MHSVRRSHEYGFAESGTYRNTSHGYSRAVLVDDSTGSVHTGLTLELLEPGGSIATHLHSFEEGFYVLEGEAAVTIDTRAVAFGPGDFGVFKVGTPHAWRNTGSAPLRWLQMA